VRLERTTIHRGKKVQVTRTYKTHLVFLFYCSSPPPSPDATAAQLREYNHEIQKRCDEDRRQYLIKRGYLSEENSRDRESQSKSRRKYSSTTMKVSFEQAIDDVAKEHGLDSTIERQQEIIKGFHNIPFWRWDLPVVVRPTMSVHRTCFCLTIL
jgi:hypothetical protein